MIYVLLLILQTFAWSATEMRLQLNATEVKQGAIVEGKLLVEKAAPALQGKSLGDQIYFYEVAPLVIRQGVDHLESAVKVIFTAVPGSSVISGKIDESEINVHIGSIKVLPTTANEKFIFGDFSIPEAPRWLAYGLGLMGVLLLGFGGYVLWKKQERKSALREKKRLMKAELLGAKNFQDLVDIWKRRQTYFEHFPHMVLPFESFEKTLYKYQFKQHQTEVEQLEAMRAYKDFVRTIEGGFNGI